LFYSSVWRDWLAFFVISSSFIIFSLAEFSFSLFRAWGKLGREAWLVIVNRIGLLLLGSVALLLNWGLSGLALAHAISAGVATIVALRWSRPASGWQWAKWAKAWPLYRQAWPLGLGLILSMLAFRIDVPLLYAFRPENEVGWYSAAYRLFEPGLLIPAALLAGFFPGLVRAAQHNRAELSSYAFRLLGSLIALGAIGGLGLALLAPFLIELIYGASFAPAVIVLQILGLVVPVIFLNYGLTHLLIALHREGWNTFFFGAALATNVFSNLLLIPAFGGAGAAWATFLTELVLCILCIISLLRFKKVSQLSAPHISQETGIAG
jgi:O-antigen/teichoic acid export membrane protein